LAGVSSIGGCRRGRETVRRRARAGLARRVRRWKSAGGRCKSAKVEARGQSTEYGLQRRQQRGMVGWSIEYRGMPKRKGDSAKVSASRARPKGAKVERWSGAPVQKWKGGLKQVGSGQDRLQSTEEALGDRGTHRGINSTQSTNGCITKFIMETPQKEASTSQYILGVGFALSWMCVTGFFSFGLFFVSVMAAGSNKAAHHSGGETIGKLLILFILLGAGLITFAGCAGGAATASVVQSDKDKKWRIFRWMIGAGLVLLAVGFLLFTLILS